MRSLGTLAFIFWVILLATTMARGARLAQRAGVAASAGGRAVINPRCIYGTRRAGALVVLTFINFGLGQTSSQIHNALSVRLTHPDHPGDLFNWEIENRLEVAVYVYDVFLWGPAYGVERADRSTVIDTAPFLEQHSCPPDRFPPVLLLVVGPHRTVRGNFSDTGLKSLIGQTVLMRVSVGVEPYRVVRQAEAFRLSKCAHNPFDAIVRWGTPIESNPLKL